MKILVVDDSPIIRAVIRKSLGMCGADVAEVMEAANGQEALDRMAEKPVDFIFTDVNMPIMNGLELVRRIAADEKLRHIPVVIVTTERSEVREQEFHALGVRGYIKKPFRPEDFRDLLKTAGK